ncbi:MAG: PEP-CTERM sorting domain-containing protein [Gammaproteobacteria bacterium]|nr:PEP-CTERM sorting domain-containing protein [Gammaproteobacteria bacterium]
MNKDVVGKSIASNRNCVVFKGSGISTFWPRAGAIAATCALLMLSAGAHAAAIAYDAGTLNFESTGQSMWGTGAAFRKEESVFVGTQWTNKTASFGGIAGSVTSTTVNTNPLWAAWWTCKNTIDVLCGDEPAKWPVTTTVDTRTGAELKVTSSGKVGLEFGYSIDSGSVDSTVQFSALADLPDAPVETTDIIDLNANSLLDSGTIETQSPKVEAYISAIMQLSGSVNAKACGILLGCAEGSTAIPTVDMDQRILSVDLNSLKVLDGILPGDEPLAEVPILNQSLTLEGAASPLPPYAGFKLTGPGGLTLASTVPPGPAVSVDLAEIEVQIPDIETSGTKSGPGTISSSGRDDFLSAQLDLDGAATLLGGLPPLGLNATLIDIPGIKVEASLDLIDADAGPVLGITQKFDLVPTLMVELAFSNPLQIAGMLDPQTSWTGKWSDLPDFSLFETTTFSPTYWIDAMLTNDFGIDLGLIGTLDVLKLGATASVAGVEVLGIGPISLNGLLGLGNTLFETDKLDFSVYDFSFGLGGFERIAGNEFTIGVRVPEPGTIGMLLIGLFAMGFLRRRYESTDRKGYAF